MFSRRGRVGVGRHVVRVCWEAGVYVESICYLPVGLPGCVDSHGGWREGLMGLGGGGRG